MIICNYLATEFCYIASYTSSYVILIFQVDCDKCDRWYHLACICKKTPEGSCLVMNKEYHFEGPCCSPA